MNRILKTVSKWSILSMTLLSAGVALAGEKIDQALETAVDGRVSIDVMSGEVQIKSWDKNEVKVVGELDDDAEGYQFEQNNNRVVFKVHMPRQRWGSWKDSGGSELTFWVPKGSELRFEGVNTDIKVDGITGSSRINTVNGDIEAYQLTSRVSLETVNGRVEAEKLEGKIKLMTVNGEIDDRDSAGELEIEAVNGDIRTNSQAEEVAVNNVNGDMNLTLKNIKELEINTVNGDIGMSLETQKRAKVYISTVGGDAYIKMPSDISANFSIEAHSGGDITNRLTSDRSTKERYGPGESLRFTTGSDAVEIEIDTVSGDIKLLKD